MNAWDCETEGHHGLILDSGRCEECGKQIIRSDWRTRVDTPSKRPLTEIRIVDEDREVLARFSLPLPDVDHIEFTEFDNLLHTITVWASFQKENKDESTDAT
jgi:hypothetical protein